MGPNSNFIFEICFILLSEIGQRNYGSIIISLEKPRQSKINNINSVVAKNVRDVITYHFSIKTGH